MGIAGSVASLIGLGLAVYFYYASIHHPELTFYVNPARATVVSAGQAQGLVVSHHDSVIKSDVSAVQIAVWNAGTSPIRQEDILVPISIRSKNKSPILEATIRKTSRPEIGLVINESSKAEGSIAIDWKVIEQDDGASIQLIYAGPASETFEIAGGIVGQRKVIERSYRDQLKSPKEQFDSSAGKRSGPWIMIIGAIVNCLLFGRGVFKRRNWSDWKISTLSGFMILMIIAQTGYGVWLLITKGDDTPPPFGF